MGTKSKRPKSEQLDELKRLVGPDSARLREEHPDLEGMLREYQRAWKEFREAVGGGASKTAATPARGRRYRADS